MQAAALLLLVLRAITSIEAAADDVNPDDNKEDFAVLCALAALANLQTTVPSIDTSGLAAYDNLQQLNLSLSSKEWKSLFNKAADSNGSPKQPPEGFQSDPTWRKQWPIWVTAAAALKAENKEAAVLARAGLTNAPEELRNRARLALIPLLAQAEQIRDRLSEIQKQNEDTTPTAIAKALNKAVYGQDKETGAVYNSADCFSGNVADSTQNSCKAGNQASKATTVAATIVCVCHKKNGGNDAANACGRLINHQSDAGANLATASSDFGDIIATCAARPPKPLTAAYLDSALAAVSARIRFKNGNGYLGKFKATGCTGSASEGLCVEYTALTAATMQNFYKIPWVKEISNVAEALKRTEKDAAESTLLSTWLKASENQGNSVAQKLIKVGDSKAVPPAQRQTQNKPGSNCNKNLKKSECKDSDGCKWNRTEETEGDFCKPKETGTENPAAGTGEGAAGANTETKKCSDKKTEGDCKDGCKWDGKECKDSSILATKKFALTVVSAAFVALLF
uniref:Variant surface glycoprotein n=2 Tax=Trypanosoma brucei TaxID=5691 RepID=B3GVK1_TRYBB|nr:variant surface glycoprotein MITat 1.3 [Trypanosoma brucei]6ELC_A Chain A, Variant surface glycoprotein [Trypanosoma brucei brucei]7P59_A Chain A, Variant surface glycoprotein [Trypanosoma brucei brucei]CAQ57384.1 variant surface glycoprotein [Trypanosoma brucei brucei]CAQ57398.1 variant surface glycoprotein [Trypanosoma brucei brucei]